MYMYITCTHNYMYMYKYLYIFQCASLKSWEWPGDKAISVYVTVGHFGST